MTPEIISKKQPEFQKAVDHLKNELATLRTGRASTGLVENIVVDFYGTATPLMHMAQISVPEPRMIAIQPFDKNSLKDIEKAIQASNLGINPVNDGLYIRLTIPQMTEERRKELAKLAGQYAEKAKIAIRNVRRDGMEALKADEKKKEISEDDRKRSEDDVQKLTDKYVALADEAAAKKEQEILAQ